MERVEATKKGNIHKKIKKGQRDRTVTGFLPTSPNKVSLTIVFCREKSRVSFCLGRGGYKITLFNELLQMKVSNEVIIEQRPKEHEGESHSDIWEKNILSRGKCKGPEAAEGESEGRRGGREVKEPDRVHPNS